MVVLGTIQTLFLFVYLRLNQHNLTKMYNFTALQKFGTPGKIST